MHAISFLLYSISSKIPTISEIEVSKYYESLFAETRIKNLFLQGLLQYITYGVNRASLDKSYADSMEISWILLHETFKSGFE